MARGLLPQLHNTISQWLFPKLFAGGDNELWLGESGLLPTAAYVLAIAMFYVWMRRRGPSWRELTRRAGAASEAASPTVDPI